MTRTLSVLAAAALAASCTTSAAKLDGFGPEAYVVSCDDAERCVARAERLCRDGYERFEPGAIVRLGAVAISPANMARSAAASLVGRSIKAQRTLYVRCTAEEIDGAG